MDGQHTGRERDMGAGGSVVTDGRITKLHCSSFYGYDEYLLPDGSSVYHDRDTDEEIGSEMRKVPIGAIVLTPKQLAAQRAYKERKEKLAAQKSELGDFIYAHSNEGAFHDLPADTMARAAYLATFIHFDTDELWRTERTRLSQKDLPSIMKLSKSTADRFWRNVKDLYFRRDDDGFLHSVGRSFVKGRLNVPYAVEYQKLYVAALKELYEKIPTSQHKRLGYALKMLPYLNFEFNVLCHNPTEKVYDMIEPMTVSDFCYAVGFDQSNVHKLAKEYGKLTFTVDNRREVFCKFVYNGGDLSTAHVYINPRLVYKGTDFRKVEAIGISFAANSKPIE